MDDTARTTTVTDDDRRAVAAFRQAFDRLRVETLAVLLRPKAFEAPAVFDGDVDVLSDPARFGDVVRVAVDAARDHGVTVLVDQRAPVKRRLVFAAAGSRNGVLLELWPRAEALPADGAHRRPGIVAWRDVAPRLDRDADGGVVLPADVAAAFYLAHLHHKRKSLGSGEVRQRLAHFREAVAAGETATDEVGRRLVAAIDGLVDGTMDLAGANAEAIAVLDRLGLPVRWPAADRAARTWRRGRRATRRAAAAWPVPVVGPDGVGKTTLLDALAERTGATSAPFKKAFRRSYAYRGLHRVLRPRSGEKRNLLDERMAVLLVLIARVRWPWFARRLRRRGSGPVLVDRWFWDYLLRLRDRSRPPARVGGYALLSRLVPVPRRAVVLVCRYETMNARKQDLTAEAVDALLDVYADQVARTRPEQVLVASTDATPDQVATAVAPFLT